MTSSGRHSEQHWHPGSLIRDHRGDAGSRAGDNAAIDRFVANLEHPLDVAPLRAFVQQLRDEYGYGAEIVEVSATLDGIYVRNWTVMLSRWGEDVGFSIPEKVPSPKLSPASLLGSTRAATIVPILSAGVPGSDSPSPPPSGVGLSLPASGGVPAAE